MMGSGVRQKTECKKCGELHWRFLGCDAAKLANERDRLREIAEREVVVERLKTAVIPVPRVQPRPLIVSRNFIEQAPGVYRRRRDV